VTQRPLDYEPQRQSRGPDRLFSLATAGLLLGGINALWATVAMVADRLDPSPAFRPVVAIILCGIVPSSVVGVILAFAATRNAHRWLIFGTNAASLLVVTFLLLRRI
jgi:hypothetical protein